MTDTTDNNLPATIPTRALVSAPADTDSWTGIVGEIAKLATYVTDTEFVPRALRGRAPATAAAILYGREIGVPPMTALSTVHVIEGTPSLSAEQMRSMVYAAGHELEFLESTGAVCKIRGRRRGSETWTPVEWSIDMARAAGLLAKKGTVWTQYPRRMLQARATSELCELVFPDVIRGLRSVETLEDEERADEEAAQTQPAQTSKVTRKRAPTTRAPAAPVHPDPDPPASPSRRSTRTDVPLPGEDGYGSESPGSDGSGPTVATAVAGSEEPAAAPAPDPGTRDAAADGPAPATREEPDPSPSEEEPSAAAPDEIVDAEIVGDVPPAGPERIRPAQNRMILAKLGALGLKGAEHRDERLRLTGYIVGREIASSMDLTKAEASTMIDSLALCADLAQLRQVAEETHAADAERTGAEHEEPEPDE